MLLLVRRDFIEEVCNQCPPGGDEIYSSIGRMFYSRMNRNSHSTQHGLRSVSVLGSAQVVTDG
jgi:Na+-translocating ferredoxin:NAD+ oxidoreductase RNF subunit RnfB